MTCGFLVVTAVIGVSGGFLACWHCYEKGQTEGYKRGWRNRGRYE